MGQISAYRKLLGTSGVARRLIPPNWFRRVQYSPSRPQVRASRVIFTRPRPEPEVPVDGKKSPVIGLERKTFAKRRETGKE
jgi:hypothetical protein